MAYRGDDGGDSLEAATAEGTLAAVLAPTHVELALAQRSLHVADGVATLVDRRRDKPERRASIKIGGTLVVARGFPRESLGIWVEVAGERAMQRMFGVEPADLLDGSGLAALARLDGLAHRVRGHLGDLLPDVRRGVEIGSGHALDKVLLADHGDRHEVYARRLFRDRARFAMAIHTDGRIVVPERKRTREVTVTSRFGVTVRGDYIRFADRHGSDLARVAVPWIGPEDRDELARRIGLLVDRPDRDAAG